MTETVVEIGAGLGALTVYLAQEARRVVALERDPALARFLREEIFPEAPEVEVLCQDVLEFDFLGLSREMRPAPGGGRQSALPDHLAPALQADGGAGRPSAGRC